MYPEWMLSPGFGTQKEGPFPLNRCVPLMEVTDTKIMWKFSRTQFCILWMEVSLEQRCPKEEVPLYKKGVPFVNKRYTKGVPSLLKMVYKRVRGWTSPGVEPLRGKLFWVPPPTPPPDSQLAHARSMSAWHCRVTFKYKDLHGGN